MKGMRSHDTEEGNQVLCLRRYFIKVKLKTLETYRGTLPFVSELLTHRTYCHMITNEPKILARFSQQLDSYINNKTIELYLKKKKLMSRHRDNEA